METLKEKVEAFIMSRTALNNAVTFKEIAEHFINQGYTSSEVDDAMRAFFNKRAAKVTSECD
jgi:hypothetical protein